MVIGSRFERGVGDMCRASKTTVNGRYLNESIKSGLGLFKRPTDLPDTF